MALKILMIAPEPFFQPRGTPFSVFHRIKALTTLGHQVDLLTYNLGEPASMAGLNVIRTPAVPGIRQIGIGFSWKKFPLWLILLVMAWRRLRRGGYDLIHTHEDALFIGALIAGHFRLPHLYDMHSSLPQQFQNYDVPLLKHFVGFFKIIEKWAVKRTQAIIAICPALVERVKEIDPSLAVELIENVALTADASPPTPEQIVRKRAELQLGEHPVVMYTGTLEHNQGLDFLLRACKRAMSEIPDLRLVMVGGEPYQIADLKEQARQMGISQAVLFLGRQPVNEMSLYMGIADVLVSPRSIGTNTPLKIYSYMQSGKAILATDLETHRQVLSQREALLVPLDVEAFAAGIVKLMSDPSLRKELGRAAQQLLSEQYSYQRYLERTQSVLARLANR